MTAKPERRDLNYDKVHEETKSKNRLVRLKPGEVTLTREELRRALADEAFVLEDDSVIKIFLDKIFGEEK